MSARAPLVEGFGVCPKCGLTVYRAFDRANVLITLDPTPQFEGALTFGNDGRVITTADYIEHHGPVWRAYYPHSATCPVVAR